jgi:hypothetical protein
MRRLAIGLLSIAARLLPKSRAEWARAMFSEMHCLENDLHAAHWAAGCCIASIKERVNTMHTGNFRIAPWVFCLEMILCFVPLSIGWLDSLFGGAGIIRLNGEVISRHFIGAPGSEIVLVLMVSGAIFGVLGPIGLIAAFRLVALGIRLRSPWLRTALIVGPLLYGMVTLVFQFALGGPKAFSLTAIDALDLWSGVLLLSVLPALGAAHMLLFGLGRSAETASA